MVTILKATSVVCWTLSCAVIKLIVAGVIGYSTTRT